LKLLGLQVPLVAAVPVVRNLVNATLRMCECYGRVVMLGRDIGGVIFAEDSLMIDTSTLDPAEVSGMILVEVFWRASNLDDETKRR